jgi:hypothetical protein
MKPANQMKNEDIPDAIRMLQIKMKYRRPSLFEEVTFSEYPETKTANNKGQLFWHLIVRIAIKKGKIHR